MLTQDFARGELSPVWRDMRRLQDEMNSIFSRMSSRPAGYPAVNMWAGPEGAVVTAELPGVKLEDLDISVVGDTLTLRGSRTPEQVGDGEGYHRRERTYGRFVRVIQLPFRTEPEEVSATLKNGLLNITLPRAQSDRPKKIEIKSS